jgi:hypothetical protein
MHAYFPHAAAEGNIERSYLALFVRVSCSSKGKQLGWIPDGPGQACVTDAHVLLGGVWALWQTVHYSRTSSPPPRPCCYLVTLQRYPFVRVV